MRTLYASPNDRNAVVGQFLKNYRFLPERKNGNALYHIIIALEPQGHLSESEISDALHDLAERYCQLRSTRRMVWGRVHHDTGFPHIHLMISANEVQSDSLIRMERKYFAKVQSDLEAWASQKLPQIRGQRVYSKTATKSTPKTATNEGELVRRAGSPSQKQKVSAVVAEALSRAHGVSDLEKDLNGSGLKLYQCGKPWGVMSETGRRYRLKTLGLERSFERLASKRELVDLHARDLPSSRNALRADERLGQRV